MPTIMVASYRITVGDQCGAKLGPRSFNGTEPLELGVPEGLVLGYCNERARNEKDRLYSRTIGRIGGCGHEGYDSEFPDNGSETQTAVATNQCLPLRAQPASFRPAGGKTNH